MSVAGHRATVFKEADPTGEQHDPGDGEFLGEDSAGERVSQPQCELAQAGAGSQRQRYGCFVKLPHRHAKGRTY